VVSSLQAWHLRAAYHANRTRLDLLVKEQILWALFLCNFLYPCFNSFVLNPKYSLKTRQSEFVLWGKKLSLAYIQNEEENCSYIWAIAAVSWRQYFVILTFRIFLRKYESTCYTRNSAWLLDGVLDWDDWIYWHIIHHSELQLKQRCHSSTHFTVHRYAHTKVLSLH
jgi:hypothetical protein